MTIKFLQYFQKISSSIQLKMKGPTLLHTNRVNYVNDIKWQLDSPWYLVQITFYYSNIRTIWQSYPLQWRHMSLMASVITGEITVCSTVCSGVHQRIIEAPCHWPFVRGIHPWLVDSPHKGPVTLNVFPLGDIIMHFYRRMVWNTSGFPSQRVSDVLPLDDIIMHFYRRMVWNTGGFPSQRVSNMFPLDDIIMHFYRRMVWNTSGSPHKGSITCFH